MLEKKHNHISGGWSCCRDDRRTHRHWRWDAAGAVAGRGFTSGAASGPWHLPCRDLSYRCCWPYRLCYPGQYRLGVRFGAGYRQLGGGGFGGQADDEDARQALTLDLQHLDSGPWHSHGYWRLVIAGESFGYSYRNWGRFGGGNTRRGAGHWWRCDTDSGHGSVDGRGAAHSAGGLSGRDCGDGSAGRYHSLSSGECQAQGGAVDCPGGDSIQLSWGDGGGLDLCFGAASNLGWHNNCVGYLYGGWGFALVAEMAGPGLEICVWERRVVTTEPA